MSEQFDQSPKNVRNKNEKFDAPTKKTTEI